MWALENEPCGIAIAACMCACQQELLQVRPHQGCSSPLTPVWRLLCVLQSPTLTDALFIPRGVLPYLRGVGLLLVAVLQGVAVPQLAQVCVMRCSHHSSTYLCTVLHTDSPL